MSQDNNHKKISEDNKGTVINSLKTLFILRTIICVAMVLAGICIQIIGCIMILNGTGSASENILFEIHEQIKITASGFGAVVMATAIIPFIYAYKSRPAINLTPVQNRRDGPDNGHLCERSKNHGEKDEQGSVLSRARRHTKALKLPELREVLTGHDDERSIGESNLEENNLLRLREAS